MAVREEPRQSTRSTATCTGQGGLAFLCLNFGGANGSTGLSTSLMTRSCAKQRAARGQSVCQPRAMLGSWGCSRASAESHIFASRNVVPRSQRVRVRRIPDELSFLTCKAGHLLIFRMNTPQNQEQQICYQSVLLLLLFGPQTRKHARCDCYQVRMQVSRTPA